jgi:hypothetical protein
VFFVVPLAAARTAQRIVPIIISKQVGQPLSLWVWQNVSVIHCGEQFTVA